MKKEIERLIPAAIVATRTFLLAKPDKDVVQKEYDGYAASLGAAIRTSGLIPALTFYTDVGRKDGSAARRYKLLQAVAYCLGEEVNAANTAHQRFLLEKVIVDLYGSNVFTRRVNDIQRKLPTANDVAKKQWAQKITNASIALKLAMRNFEHTKS